MTLRHLKIFAQVCENGNMTDAAEKLYMTQPAVSLAIRELETHYGIKLFDRISRKLYLTDAGKRLLDYSLHILAQFEEMETEICGTNDVGRIRIGSSITVGTCFLPEVIRIYGKKYPQVTINVCVENSGVILNRVLENRVDFGLIEGVVHSDQIRVREFARGRMVPVCAPSHALAAKKRIPLEVVAKQWFLLREKGSGARELFDSVMMTNGISIDPLWESISTRALISGVKEGIGISVLPEQLVQRELEEGELIALEFETLQFERKFSLILHKNKNLSRAARNFLEEAVPLECCEMGIL